METKSGVLRLTQEVDQKLILLPLLYFVLRVGTCILFVLFSSLCAKLHELPAQLFILLVVRT